LRDQNGDKVHFLNEKKIVQIIYKLSGSYEAYNL